MNPRGNPHTLAQARRRDSLDKRQRVLTALAALEQQGERITFTAVARTANVSTWLTYTTGLREHIEAAQRRQRPTLRKPARAEGSTAALHTELELARQEIRTLRQDNERMRHAVQHQLGLQLDALSTEHLTDRVDELIRTNQQLQDQLQQATETNKALQTHVSTLEADLSAARTSLRRMIREENTHG
ncbi:DUF6262 family protein [Streptomyces sp. B-S-A8]|uniref:DUF6262 family protein n=1 Tax=Streptomyces solicavernae TaxID=3043614 RepID=A0ABT6S247_9ACTN|nr:DUF6262 family protein [Streptomyces sp. B-S-A8]MDI3390760.1 DUF6262 family protein [Streptomyces sp. B-S-A8]